MSDLKKNILCPKSKSKELIRGQDAFISFFADFLGSCVYVFSCSVSMMMKCLKAIQATTDRSNTETTAKNRNLKREPNIRFPGISTRKLSVTATPDSPTSSASNAVSNSPASLFSGKNRFYS